MHLPNTETQMRLVGPGRQLLRAATTLSIACLAATPYHAAFAQAGPNSCDAPAGTMSAVGRRLLMTVGGAFLRPAATATAAARPPLALSTTARDMSSSSSTPAAGAGTGASSLNLDGITLKKVTSEAGALGGPIKAGSLWAPNGAVVFVVRRPGCVLCREEAMDLRKNVAPKLAGDPAAPKLLAVVAETTSVDGFLEAFGEAGATYLDEERGFQKALGDRWLGIQGLLYPSVWKNGRRAQEKYPELEGDLKGEGRRLGGLLVVDKEGQVRYQYLEKVFGDHAPVEEVLAAVDGLKK